MLVCEPISALFDDDDNDAVLVRFDKTVAESGAAMAPVGRRS